LRPSFVFHIATESFVGFYVTKTSDTSYPINNPISFNQVIVNEHAGIITSTSDLITTFTCPKSGVYWLFVTSVFDGDFSPTNVSIIITGSGSGGYVTPQVLRRHKTYPKRDTTSRDFMRNLTVGDQVSVVTQYPLSGSNEIGPSWGDFLVDNLLSTKV
jgi:hypothetical protein